MSGGMRTQLLSLEHLTLQLLLSTTFSCRVKTQLGKQEESNQLPYVSKNGKRVEGLTVTEYLLCAAGMGLLSLLLLHWIFAMVLWRCAGITAYSLWLLSDGIGTWIRLSQIPERAFNYLSTLLCRVRRVLRETRWWQSVQARGQLMPRYRKPSATLVNL